MKGTVGHQRRLTMKLQLIHIRHDQWRNNNQRDKNATNKSSE